MALSILVRLRDGRYEAAGLRPSEAEWPPHPARLFCALVASVTSDGESGTADGDADAEWAALRWLERAGMPEIWASSRARRQTRRGYVPTNSTEAKGGSQTWPGRTNGLRVRAAALPENPDFAVVWPDAEPDADTLSALVRLARRTPYVGRATSPATLTVGTKPGSPRATWTRFAPGDSRRSQVDVRVPVPGYADRLRAAYADGQRSWEVSAATLSYAPLDSTPAEAGDGELEGEPGGALDGGPVGWELLVFGQVPGTSRLPVGWLLTVTSRLREAVLSRIATDVPPEISGHGAKGRNHVAFLGLLDVGHPNASGQLLGVGLAVPPDLPDAAYARLWDAVIEDPLETLTVQRASELRLDHDPFRSTPWGLSTERWTAARRGGSRDWVTATPLMVDRFLSRRGDDTQFLEEVARSLVIAGFPAPRAVEISPAPMLAGALHRVPRAALPDNRPIRPMTHVRIRFAEPVVGPVLAGSMRYLGLGLFVPELQRERTA
ncbi:type I-U CRISPR-associated protein Csb2 [Pseudofrankia sp. BMG5.36]|uniref:type I-G CRISPR-associated protein Csb2 n=1 Tax=Pseudofrankia sp. BMG5.36 TaxID=1834512 RepID=UPI0008DA83B0|nr:type I-U CRISPR-associated protein Csb2 [Pseudofrankia sp. BMG5.36]OHV43948.1 type I-U CRISPR-associated protein Cas5/Cas6 [Pseudofrankia sp. BMG5.36]